MSFEEPSPQKHIADCVSMSSQGMISLSSVIQANKEKPKTPGVQGTSVLGGSSGYLMGGRPCSKHLCELSKMHWSPVPSSGPWSWTVTPLT